MKFFRRFIYPIVIFALLSLGTFVIQATKSNCLSAFLVEWAKTWGTFIGALAALFVVGVAFFTYWVERKDKLLEMKQKLSWFAIDALSVWQGLENMLEEDKPLINETERQKLLKLLENPVKEASNVSTLAEKFGGKMQEHVETMLEGLSDMHLLLISKTALSKTDLRDKIKEVPSRLEQIIRYEVI